MECSIFEKYLVTLVGGSTPGTGNVYAKNPATGIYGQVCDRLWDIADVSHIGWLGLIPIHNITCNNPKSKF
jgi:hypothetical protein